jgi:hypothetical protein
MKEVRNFVATLASARKDMNEIKIPTDQVYGNSSLDTDLSNYQRSKGGKNTADQRHSNLQKTTEDIIAAVATAVEEDRLLTVRGHASALGQNKDTIRRILSENVGLVKMSFRWVLKLLIEDQKKNKEDKYNGLLKPIWSYGLSFLDTIFAMYESAVFLHTSETKQQSKNGFRKDSRVLLRQKSIAPRIMQEVFVFFHLHGVIYTNHIP